MQVTSSVCLIGSSLVGAICPPVGYAVGGLGWKAKKIGNRIVDSANIANIAPSITKIV